MKKLCVILALTALLSLTACMGRRGNIGGQPVCENDYFLGVISITEWLSPCSQGK